MKRSFFIDNLIISAFYIKIFFLYLFFKNNVGVQNLYNAQEFTPNHLVVLLLGCCPQNQKLLNTPKNYYFFFFNINSQKENV